MLNEQSNLCLNNEGENYLRETARWASFLSILGYIGIGFMIILGIIFSFAIFQSSQIADSSLGILMLFVYLALAGLYFYPIYTLHQFSKNSNKAIQDQNQFLLNESLRNLKNCFRYIGILTIVLIALYVLLIFIMMGSGELSTLF